MEEQMPEKEADQKTSEQVKTSLDPHTRNPTGKGGFAENPGNINAGGRPKNQESFTYWMNFFKNVSQEEFLAWNDAHPKGERSMACIIAYNRVFNSVINLDEFKEVADRTEGKPKQTLIHEGGFFSKSKLEVTVLPARDVQDEPTSPENQPQPEASTDSSSI